MKIGELFIALGFDVDDKKLKEFNEGIKTGLNELLKMSAVAAGAVYAINRFVSGAVDAATALRNFNNETGESARALQKWQVVSELTNAAVTADQVTSSFKAMSSAISDVRMGKGPSGAFARLGISDVRDMTVPQVLEQLRANHSMNVGKWKQQGVSNLYKEIGLDLGMLPALQKTREEFEKLGEDLLLTENQRKSLVDLGDAMRMFVKQLEYMQSVLSAEWAPTLMDWMKRAIPIMKDFGLSLAAVASAAAELFNSMGPEWQKGLVVAAGAILAAFMPLRTMFVGLALAIDDVGHALRGTESFIGKSLLGLSTLTYSEAGSPNDRFKWKMNHDNNLGLTKEALRTKGDDPYAKGASSGGSISSGGGLPGIPAKGKMGKDVSWDNPLGDLGTQENYDLLARYSRYGEEPPIAGGMRGGIGPYGPMTSAPTSINQHNIYNIQSAEDALALSDHIARANQRMLNSAQAELNNSTRF